MKTAIMIVMAMVMATGSLYGADADQPPAIPSDEQPEVLTRGPVNEAFAQPVNMDDQTGLVAPTEPPANIEEVPPADRPSGDQFVWVPGYWAWDSDRNGYIWVSGCWRAAPPGMYWVPGYWVRAAGGWQWVAGFWSPVGNQEIEYLPAPPALTDAEIAPPMVAPSPDRVWVPPCWFWYHGQYIRRPGYWIVAQPDWVWVPSHYVWTPRGYVFVNGHWDYSLSRRGVLFAPVYFPRHVYERPGFSYSLSIAVDTGNLEFGLFTCPRYSHYYFGDYYDDVYIGVGIFPWFECERRHTWYDPIYEHDRWRHRDEPRWDDHERQEYDRRRADKDLRPPRTYREMESKMGRMPESQRRSFEMAEPMNRVVERKTTTMKFEQIKPDARQQMSSHSTEVHKFSEDRSRWESQGAGRKGQPVIEKVPSNDRKETASPVERKGPEMKPEERKGAEIKPQERKGPEVKSEERKGAEMKPTDRKETAPVENKGPVTPAEQQKQTKVSPREAEQNQSDKVKVSNPPVVGKKEGGFFKKSPPSKPAEEQKTESKDTSKEKDTQKSNDARSNKDTQKGNDARSDKDTQKNNDARNNKDTQKSNDSGKDKGDRSKND